MLVASDAAPDKKWKRKGKKKSNKEFDNFPHSLESHSVFRCLFRIDTDEEN
jgi:hypothetical protein